MCNLLDKEVPNLFFFFCIISHLDALNILMPVLKQIIVYCFLTISMMKWRMEHNFLIAHQNIHFVPLWSILDNKIRKLAFRAKII